MTKDDLLKFFDGSVANMRGIMERKNADYTGGAKAVSDCFANFSRVETLGIASTEQGFLTRMADKLMRINSLVQQPAQVKEETITDTLLDLANYSILFAAYLNSKRSAVDES